VDNVVIAGSEYEIDRAQKPTAHAETNWRLKGGEKHSKIAFTYNHMTCNFNQSINQSVSQSINQPINQPIKSFIPK